MDKKTVTTLKILNSELEVLIDEDMVEVLSKHKWIRRGVYIGRVEFKNKKQTTYLLHRVVMGAKLGELVDHKNQNPLDNRRENLRLCTRRQNAANSKLASNNTSGFRGVNFMKNRGWRAHITINGKAIHLGMFETKEEAALKYNESAIEYFGEFAALNKV